MTDKEPFQLLPNIDLISINVDDAYAADSLIQYAIVHLRTPLMVVMGHEQCGAVTATLESLAGNGTEPRLINLLIDRIKPGLANLPASTSGTERVHLAVEANVRWAIHQLAEIPEGKERLKNKTVTLVGAVYELDQGTVRFLD